MGERAYSRCIAITKKGTRCSLNTCAVGPKSWMHTLADENLRVKQSHIKEAGKGLYPQKGFRPNKSNKSNEVVFKKGATIGPYTGIILSAEEVQSMFYFQTGNINFRTPTPKFLEQPSNNHTIFLINFLTFFSFILKSQFFFKFFFLKNR